MKLRDDLKETVNLGFLDGAYVVHGFAVSPHMMRLAAREGSGFVHSTTLGKAIASARVRAILEAPGCPPSPTPPLTDPDAFLTEVETHPARGFGLEEESQVSSRCLAVPIGDIALPAGLGVSAPTNRLPLKRLPDVVKELKRTARILSQQGAWLSAHSELGGSGQVHFYRVGDLGREPRRRPVRRVV